MEPRVNQRMGFYVAPKLFFCQCTFPLTSVGDIFHGLQTNKIFFSACHGTYTTLQVQNNGRNTWFDNKYYRVEQKIVQK